MIEAPRPVTVIPRIEEIGEPEPVLEINGDGRHVLVVEDDKDIAELIGRHLASHGYQVSIAGRARKRWRRRAPASPV